MGVVTTPAQLSVEDRRREVSARYLRGDTQTAIGEALGVTQQQISKDLKVIRAAWLASSIRDFDTARAEELARLDRVEHEYWLAWERSQESKEITYEEQGPKGKRSGSRYEGQAGNAAFLDGVLKCIAKRCEILGLDAPKRFVINWDELTPEQEDRLARGEPPEKVLAA